MKTSNLLPPEVREEIATEIKSMRKDFKIAYTTNMDWFEGMMQALEWVLEEDDDE